MICLSKQPKLNLSTCQSGMGECGVVMNSSELVGQGCSPLRIQTR